MSSKIQDRFKIVRKRDPNNHSFSPQRNTVHVQKPEYCVYASFQNFSSPNIPVNSEIESHAMITCPNNPLSTLQVWSKSSGSFWGSQFKLLAYPES